MKKDFVNNGKDECSRYLIFSVQFLMQVRFLLMTFSLRKQEGLDEEMRVSAVGLMWAMLLISDIAFVAEPLNYYRNGNL